MGRIPAGLDVVDHINRNTLDNTWQNLRFATFSANMQNATRKVSKSGFIGVIERGNQCYQTIISYNGSMLQLGFYRTPEVAAHAYNCGALEIHGEGAKLNDVPIPPEYEWDPTMMKLEQIAPIKLPAFDRNKNGFKGVDLVQNKYRANIQFSDGTHLWLGTFDTPEIAAWAHNKASLEIYGNKAVLNDVPEPTGYKWDPIRMRLIKVGIIQFTKIRHGNSYRGVTKTGKKFAACIYLSPRKRIHLGFYETIELAAIAYNFGLKHFNPDQNDLKLNEVDMPDGYNWDSEQLRVVRNAES